MKENVTLGLVNCITSANSFIGKHKYQHDGWIIYLVIFIIDFKILQSSSS